MESRPFWHGLALRLVLTPVLMFTRHPLLMAVALWLLDLSDCNLTAMLGWIKKKDCAHNKVYQMGDKVVDVIQYLVALCVLTGTGSIPEGLVLVLWALWAWRLVGVLRFVHTGDVRVLVPHFDAIKELLVASSMLPMWPETIVFVCACKAFFEVWKNGTPVRLI